MTAPGLLALCLIVLFPLFFTIFTSGFDYTLLHRKLRHLRRARQLPVASGAKSYFGQSLWVTLNFVVAVVLLEFLIGFTVALMLNAGHALQGRLLSDPADAAADQSGGGRR